MGVLVEQVVCEALREHLLLKLPAKVTEVNALRAPVLKSPIAGPFNISGTKKLRISKTGTDSGHVEVTLTTGGAQTATQVAADINATVGLVGVASADAAGRLLLTGTAPTGSVATVIGLGDDSSTPGSNAIFGWPEGGEAVTRAPLVSPGTKGVADGWPLLNDLGPGFWVILGDRESVPVGSGPRTDEHLAAVELAIFCPVTNEQVHRDREAIQSCMRCVRECVLTDEGRQAGHALTGDIVLVTEKAARVPGRPWKFRGENAPNALFDVAALQLNVRVFERPAST